jgi:fatty acid desaturase
MWNMSYHTAHHTFPSVPFHRLPELHRVIERQLGKPVPAAGYLECHLSLLRAFRRGVEPLEPAEGEA